MPAKLAQDQPTLSVSAAVRWVLLTELTPATAPSAITLLQINACLVCPDVPPVQDLTTATALLATPTL